jgi:hypothetical protein
VGVTTGREGHGVVCSTGPCGIDVFNKLFVRQACVRACLGCKARDVVSWHEVCMYVYLW